MVTGAGAAAPRVSVVVATYDRPRALAAALASLVDQTVTDWEAIVVGDACDERTTAVVEELGDDRIRYVNLARNVGEQSGPNNVGAALARADLLAYLNHDDLWFPDHLATGLEALQASSADLVFATNANVLWTSPDLDSSTVVLDSLGRRGRYDPAAVRTTVPASGWLARRSLIEGIGGWRSAAECRTEPSQDVLFRAHRAGARLRSTGAVTVVTLPSGVRDDAYVGDEASEQELWLGRLHDPTCRPSLLGSASAAAAVERRRSRTTKERLWDVAMVAAARVGLDARSIHFAVRRRFAKGAYLDELRRRRGLPPIDAGGDAVRSVWRRQARTTGPVPLDRPLSFGTGGAGAGLLAGGWSQLEPWGVWNDGPSAALVLELPTGSRSGRLVLDLVVRANAEVPGGRQVVEVGAGTTRASWSFDDGVPTDRRLEVELDGRRFLTVTFDAPMAGPNGLDQRDLAIGLEQLRVRTG